MSDPAVTLADAVDAKVLLGVLAQVRAGDFTARMPLEWTGVAGKIADGLNDVITSINAHGYGLAWYEQGREGGEITFKEHLILNRAAEPNAYGVSFSQIHSLALADIDGDGLKDIVTGKRFWAHGKHGPDPGSDSAAELYWFKLTRPKKGEAEFVPYKIDDNSGVGTQVVVGNVSDKNHPDVVVGNKKGLFVFEHQTGAKD